MSPWIPREGLYLDPLCHMFAAVFLNPLVIALPAWVLRRDTTHIGLAAKLLFGAGCVYRLNEWLNKWARNNWTKAGDWDWERELVLITGGSSGIGGGIAQKLAARKIKVVVVDCQPLRFEPGEYIHFFKCDLTDDEGWSSVAEEIRQQHGDPTVIVNNAGITREFVVAETGTESIRAIFGVNIIAQISVLREFLPSMTTRNHGHIVTISSAAAWVYLPEMVDYSATKAGTVALHEGISVELKYHHKAPRVRTTLVSPCWVRTPLFQGKTNQPWFLLPLLSVDTVTDAIVEQLLSGYGGAINLPGSVGWLPAIKAMPYWLQRLANSRMIEVETELKSFPTEEVQSEERGLPAKEVTEKSA